MARTTIYIIWGSEDGAVGASTNAKAAVQHALRYVSRSLDTAGDLARDLRTKRFITVEEEGEGWGLTYATIEAVTSLRVE